MKRSAPLRRSTGLVRSVGFPRARVRASWAEVREAVFARDGWRCQVRVVERCPAALAAHHVLRRSQGGSDALANLVTVCHGPGSCHDYIHAHPAWAYAHGFLRRSGS